MKLLLIVIIIVICVVAGIFYYITKPTVTTPTVTTTKPPLVSPGSIIISPTITNSTTDTLVGMSNGVYYSSSAPPGPWNPVQFSIGNLVNPWILKLNDTNYAVINDTTIFTGPTLNGPWITVYDTSTINSHFNNISQLSNSFVAISNVKNDTGAYISDGMKVITQLGICNESEWPYIEHNYEMQPSRNCYTSALLQKSSGYSNIAQNPVSMKNCLAAGTPFAVAIELFNSFYNTGSDGIVSMPKPPADTSIGGHAVVCVGYKIINNSPYWIMRNSWGSAWGDKGYFYLPEVYLTGSYATDLWCIN
jgi:C1A family cysteine protease